MQDFILAKREEIAEICRKHHVLRLSVFGSAARDDFNPATSDVDLLVEFLPQTRLGLSGFFAFEDDMARVFGRKVDLISDGVIKNPYLLRSIEKDREQLYAA
jgi:predicted nucleotidyltransferase